MNYRASNSYRPNPKDYRGRARRHAIDFRNGRIINGLLRAVTTVKTTFAIRK